MNKAMNRDDATRGYRAEIRNEEDGSWSLTIPSLPGLVAVGDTFDEAWEDLPDVVDLWLEAAHEKGQEVPPPDAERSDLAYSGKLMLRMPRSLHGELSRLAKGEGTSINMLCVTALTDATVRRSATGTATRPRAKAVDHFTAVTAFPADRGSQAYIYEKVVNRYELADDQRPKSVTQVFTLDDKARHAN